MASTPLLPFQKSILSAVHSTQLSDLIIMARGLGLRRIVCELLQHYDAPTSLVLLLNATPSEEAGIGDELGIMGCRKPGLRIVTFEMGSKDRQDLYRQGGLISVTSRILVVDMLLSDISVESISGIIVLHAERVTPQSTEAFIIRLFRQNNTEGFLKAFTDEPEHITVGFSPLKDIMKELQVRNVHIYPRFHETVKESLERRKADVVQIAVPMTSYMKDIHGAIIQCIEGTLSDLKRNNTELNLDDLNVQSAYFRSFDMMAKRQLSSVWHRVGFRTKQLVGDLATLRRLLLYLLSYDPLGFQAYIETIIASNSTTATGQSNHNRSAWLTSDAAHIIFQSARRRCFVSSKQNKSSAAQNDAWDVLDEISGTVGVPSRPSWLPDNITPVLEEPPKWETLTETLLEIEDLIMRYPFPTGHPGTNNVLIMCSSDRTCNQIREFLSSMDPTAKAGSKGRKFMESRLRSYLFWKGKLGQDAKRGEAGPSNENPSHEMAVESGVSEALKRKDARMKERQASRRRVRGGPPPGASNPAAFAAVERAINQNTREGAMGGEGVIKEEADELATFLNGIEPVTEDMPDMALLTQMALEADDFDEHYGLVQPDQLVVVRPYSDDTDDRVLSEIKPRFIIMYEPKLDFVRRIELYRSATPGLAVRVYVTMWDTSAEEDMYLAELRREKDAFESLIRERANMVLVIQEKPSTTQARTDALIRTISTRNAGGKSLEMGRPLVIVDIREFRSSLPGLLHVSGIDVHPITLTVGDYILTPDMVVERKSVSDLISSFNSGRLYTQCELMSAHYKEPLLLIEFEHDQSFSLQTLLDAKSGAKPTGKYPAKKQGGGPPDPDTIENTSVQSKLVLLTLAFPRLRIIWSSSPYATAEIFADLKTNNTQPDPVKAASIGAEEMDLESGGINVAAEELLRSLPGITSINFRHVISMVGSIRELCDLDLGGMQAILGVEAGKTLHTFLHRGSK